MFEYVEKRFVWVTVVGERGKRRVCVAGNATGPLRQERNLFFLPSIRKNISQFFSPSINYKEEIYFLLPSKKRSRAAKQFSIINIFFEESMRVLSVKLRFFSSSVINHLIFLV